MQYLRLFLLSALLTACALKDPRRFKETNPGFAEYVQAYETQYNRAIYDLPINFGYPGDDRAGACYSWAIGYKEIIISSGSWEHLTDHQKVALIYHELAHCDMGQRHRDKLLPDSCPASLMHSSLASDSCLRQHWDQLLAELNK